MSDWRVGTWGEAGARGTKDGSHLDAADTDAERGYHGAKHLLLERAGVALDDAAHHVADAGGIVSPLVPLQAHFLHAAVQALERRLVQLHCRVLALLVLAAVKLRDDCLHLLLEQRLRRARMLVQRRQRVRGLGAGAPAVARSGELCRRLPRADGKGLVAALLLHDVVAREVRLKHIAQQASVQARQGDQQAGRGREGGRGRGADGGAHGPGQ